MLVAIIEKNMSRYQELVSEAKRIMVAIECHQSELARLAMEACEIQRGGDSSDRYTLLDFANDAGVPHSSLKLWVGIYRDVFQKIDKHEPTKEEWNTGSRTYHAMRSLVSDETAKGRGYKKNLPKEKVEKLYNSVAEKDEDSLAAHQALRYANMIRASLTKVDLKTQNPALLSQILNVLNPINTKIADHLTAKRIAK